MTNVIVTYPQSRGGLKGLQVKINASEDPEREVFWEFGVLPKELTIGERIYITCNNVIQGYFVCDDIEEASCFGGKAFVVLRDWTPVTTPIAYESVRGFHYLRGGKLDE